AWLTKHTGRSDAGLEVVARTLRVAEKGGVSLTELGIPSLMHVHGQEPDKMHGPGHSKDASAPVSAPDAQAGRAPGSKIDRAAVLAKVRQLFADKTGYELSDLEPAFQLEADLGIDTVKQAEIMSIIREKYNFGKDEGFKLSQVPTLDAVADYVASRANAGPEFDASTVQAKASSQSTLPVQSTSPFTSPAKVLPNREQLFAEIRGLFADKTGYELSDLEPAFQLEADLGIDTVKQAEIMSVIREKYGFAKDEEFKLASVQTLDAVVNYVVERLNGAEEPEPTPPTKAVAPTATTHSTNGAAQTSAAAPRSVAPAASLVMSREKLFNEVRAIFVEKTGYDATDLEPAFQLEADLGTDTVKQAEILSILRERYGLGKDETFRLSQVQTLDAVVDYVMAGFEPQTTTARASEEGDQSPKWVAGATKTAAPAQVNLLPKAPNYAAPPSTAATSAAPGKATTKKSAIKAPSSIAEELATAPGFAAAAVGPIKVSVPHAVRSLAGRHVVLVGTDAPFRQAMREALLGMGANIHLVNPESLSDDGLEKMFADLGGRPADDLIVLASEQDTINVSAIEADVAKAMRLSRAFTRARGSMKNAGLLFAGRSNGIFGKHTSDASGLVLGALSGIAKSLAKEWPEARTTAVDLDRTTALPQAAKQALDAWLGNGPVEIAFHQNEVWTLEHGATAEGTPVSLPTNAVVVASGGARGVTFAVVREIAKLQPLRIVLLARTAAVAKADSALKGNCDADYKECAKAALAASGKRVTPAEIKRWIESERSKTEVTHNLDELRVLGSDVELVICDVANLGAMGQVYDDIKAKYGHVDLLIHGAGHEESKMLAEKDADAFERVFGPKARAGLSMYVALKPKRMLTMGSVAARFGNAGQADYSASNELLAALARTDGRDIVNVDWTAWGDIGMATKDNVKHVLEASGVRFLPAALGARLGASLALSTFKGDVVVAGELGLFAPAATPPKEAAVKQADHSVKAVTLPAVFDRRDGTTYIRRLDAKRDIGIEHHRIDGIAVLPGVLGLELMTAAAVHATSRRPARLEEVKFTSPVKLHRDEPVDARVDVSIDGEKAKVVLSTSLVSPTGKAIKREHFTVTIVFGAHDRLSGPAIRSLEMPRDPGIDSQEIYKRYFHGPVFQVIGKVTTFGEDGAEGRSVAPWPTWLTGIGHQQMMTMPFARETAFQVAGLWEMAEFGRMALPAGVASIELGEPVPAGTEVIVEARRLSSSPNGSVFDIWTRSADGRIHDVMRGYRTVTLRPLTDDERFEPTYRRELTQNWLSVEIDEIQLGLVADEAATLERYLAPQEHVRFRELKSEKRKIDWLAGRIVAKRLIRESYFAKDGAIVPYSAITIVPDELGAPQVSIAFDKNVTHRISISHSAGCAAAMLSVEPGVRPGIDVESIEARDPSFGRDYFTQAERSVAKGSDGKHTDEARVFTSIWAVKEAVVKALGIGARVDLRDIEALPSVTVSSTQSEWSVTLKGEALQRAEALGAGAPRVELTTMGQRVVARVLMPVNEQKATAQQAKPEVSA
ncbi:MAG: SDR family NAD(P)-dependent oxidoreductase, partial [Clostridia bacterium]|nr:SDR family NAD(P)-dependent oxidoreductase [Deltaproteobacteria bacterium]